VKNFSGWLCLDKPEGMSSNLAMIKARKKFECNAGYVGTLDPFATGVLPIAVGETRKFIQYVSDVEKTYVFAMKFGEETDSLDIDGEVVRRSEKIPSRREILDILPNFIGEQYQVPPVFSAIKVNGKRACDRVRSGESVELASRKITIMALDCIDEKRGVATLNVVCSKGTYVRSLARDIAAGLGTVAYLQSLRRMKSGFFSISDAISLEKLQKIDDTEKLARLLVPNESPLDDIPALYLRTEDVVRLQNGLQISVDWSELESSKVLIFDDLSREFKGVGFISADGEVKAVRMCAYNNNIGVIKDVDRK
jgi:tRNA pseudouridine55 synthase